MSENDTPRNEPTLYLESNRPEPGICSKVFESGREEEYRIVQLTSTQNFETLQGALEAKANQMHTPSEAGVVMLTPQTDETDVITADVGDRATMYGFRIDPEDLTGISIAFSRLIQKWDDTDGSIKICLRGIESLYPYHEKNLLYRFLHTVIATLQGAGTDVHMHIQPAATDDQTLQLIKSLFTKAIDADASEPKHESAPVSTESTSTTSRETSFDSSPDFDGTSTTQMTSEQIDDFLESESNGTLALAGDPPYAIPMSYGYDTDEQVVYIQMGMSEASEKRARLATSSSVSLVVSRYSRPDKWRSVIVDGSLTELSTDEVQKRKVTDTFFSSEFASIDVFMDNPSNMSFKWYMLEPANMSGRKSVSEI